MAKKIISWIIVLAFITGAGYLIKIQSAKPGKYDAFAECLKDQGAVFYGAFWCPHCQNQKTMFGKSAKLLPYVECSTPDGKSQTEECKAKKVEGYPTWEFKDGSRLTGEIPFTELSSKTGCQLPL